MSDPQKEAREIAARHGIKMYETPAGSDARRFQARRIGPRQDRSGWQARGEAVTDEEIICTWMSDGKQYGYPWWTTNWNEIRPRVLTLDALHEVEERLTNEQWPAYVESLIATMPQKFPRVGEVIHATSEQKLKALASVLRAGIRTPVEGESNV